MRQDKSKVASRSLERSRRWLLWCCSPCNLLSWSQMTFDITSPLACTLTALPKGVGRKEKLHFGAQACFPRPWDPSRAWSEMMDVGTTNDLVKRFVDACSRGDTSPKRCSSSCR